MNVFERIDGTVAFADEERMLVDAVRALAAEKIAPHAVQKTINVLEVFVALLHADDVVIGLFEAGDRVDLKVDGSASGDVVEDDRQIGAFGNGIEVAE